MWSEIDLKYLVDNYSKLSNQEIGEKLHKTKKSVDSKAIRLGLKKDSSYISNVNRIRTINRLGDSIWTKEDLDFLTFNIDKMSNPELSKRLDKTINSIVSKINILGLKRSPVYSKEYIGKECLKYITKQELRISDPNLYHWLYSNGKMKDVSSHMYSVSYSTPQIILKYILEKVTNKKISYNDRRVIKPYEIDIYFPDYKLAFEYDGIFYHDGNNFKYKLCSEIGIDLIVIDEVNLNKKGFEYYVINIKNQLVNYLDRINNKLEMNINKNEILSLNIDKSKLFKGLFDIDKLKIICQSYKDYSKFIKEQKSTYNKLYYLGLLNDFTKHMKVEEVNSEKFNFILEKKNFYKRGDLVLIEYWYNDMITVCEIVDIIGRKYKVSHNINQSEIKNAPDEVIKSSDIIDKLKNPS